MAARSSWKGFIRLSLVSVPVKAFTANSSGGGEVRLNQIHQDCHSRIKYQKVCPVHGEVANDAIVSGYEFAKDQYVVIDPEEIDKLRSESDKAVRIDTFVDPESIDPIYFSGKSYYLVPDGPVAHKPYALLVQGMKEMKRSAVARVVLHSREHLVLVRPLDKLLVMEVLAYEQQVNKPSAFKEEVPEQTIEPAEMDLVKTLIKASTAKKFDLAQYKDDYTEKLTKLIEAKVQGKEIVTPPAVEEAQVINLMDALRQSIKQAGAPAAEEAAAPTKKMAKSKPPPSRVAAQKKRKSS
jgi:DNA end-binding protein Ku